jgi:hypothetical protein
MCMKTEMYQNLIESSTDLAPECSLECFRISSLNCLAIVILVSFDNNHSLKHLNEHSSNKSSLRDVEIIQS